MVVGSGMLAQAFSHFLDDENIIIFASGVSNSTETNPLFFQREFDLLSLCNKHTKLVYFSTCSVYDNTLKDSMYVKHKMNIEKYIMTNFSNYIILRLPVVIGVTSNKNTFFSYFVNQISSGEKIKIQESAFRYLIDIEDVVNIFNIINSNVRESIIINLAFNNKDSALNLASMIAESLGVSLNVDIVPGGDNYNIPNETLFGFLETNNYIIPENYNNIVINKYANKLGR